MADAMATKLKPPVWEKQVELDSFVHAENLTIFTGSLYTHIPPPPFLLYPLSLLPPPSYPLSLLPPPSSPLPPLPSLPSCLPLVPPQTYTHTAQWSWCTKAACTDTSNLAPYLAPHIETLDHTALLPWTPICSTFPGLHCCLSGANEQGQSTILFDILHFTEPPLHLLSLHLSPPLLYSPLPTSPSPTSPIPTYPHLS